MRKAAGQRANLRLGQQYRSQGYQPTEDICMPSEASGPGCDRSDCDVRGRPTAQSLSITPVRYRFTVESPAPKELPQRIVESMMPEEPRGTDPSSP